MEAGGLRKRRFLGSAGKSTAPRRLHLEILEGRQLLAIYLPDTFASATTQPVGTAFNGGEQIFFAGHSGDLQFEFGQTATSTGYSGSDWNGRSVSSLVAANLPQPVGRPALYEASTTYLGPIDPLHAVYRTAPGSLVDVWSDPWQSATLVTTGVASDPSAYSFNGGRQVLYIGDDDHVHLVASANHGTTWFDYDLHGVVGQSGDGNANAVAATGVTAFIYMGHEYYVYQRSDGGLGIFRLENSAWHYDVWDASDFADYAPPAAGVNGTLESISYSMQGGSGADAGWILYQDTSGQLRGVWLAWNLGRHTAVLSNVPMAGAPSSAFDQTHLKLSVAFYDTNAHLHVVQEAPTGWTDRDYHTSSLLTLPLGNINMLAAGPASATIAFTDTSTVTVTAADTSSAFNGIEVNFVDDNAVTAGQATAFFDDANDEIIVHVNGNTSKEVVASAIDALAAFNAVAGGGGVGYVEVNDAVAGATFAGGANATALVAPRPDLYWKWQTIGGVGPSLQVVYKDQSQHVHNLRVTNDSGRFALDTTAFLEGYDESFGYGIVNADRAVAYALGSSTALTDVVANSTVETDANEHGTDRQLADVTQGQFSIDAAAKTIMEQRSTSAGLRTTRWTDFVQSENGSEVGYRQHVFSDYYAYPASITETMDLPSGRTETATVQYPSITQNSAVVSLNDSDLQDIRQRSGDYEAFKAALEKVKRTNARVLNIPAGTYHVTAPENEQTSILISGINDLLIEGNGAELLFTGKRTGILIRGSNRVQLRNLTIDWVDTLAHRGIIRQHGDDTHLILSDAVNGDQPPIRVIVGFRHDTNDWNMGDVLNHPNADIDISYAKNIEDQHNIAPVGELDGRFAYKLTFPRAASIPDGTQVIATERVNDTRAVMVGRKAGQITIEKVTVHGSPGVAFAVNGADKGFRLADSVVTRNSSRPISTLADGIVVRSGGDVFIENNTFEHQGDDAINLYNVHHTGAVIGDDRRMIAVNGLQPFFRAGDGVLFSSKDTMKELGRLTVTEVVNPGAGGCPQSAQLCACLDAAVPAGMRDGDLVLNTNLNPERFVIRSNTIRNNRARGMLVQVRQGIVENNTITDVPKGGIWLINDIVLWMQGDGPGDVIVRDNLLQNIGFGTSTAFRDNLPLQRFGPAPQAAILVESRVPLADNPAHGLSAEPIISHILIEKNRIFSIPGRAIFIGSAIDVTVQDNELRQAGSHAQPGRATAVGSIMVTHSSNVRVRRNILTDSAQIVIDPQTTANVIVSAIAGSSSYVFDTANVKVSSAAASHISSVVALMLNANPDLTPHEVESILIASADSVLATASTIAPSHPLLIYWASKV